jgi:hypothetical protein
MLGKKSRRVFCPTTEVLEARELLASGLTIQVTNADNAGPGSLRRAIKLSNAHLTNRDSPNIINFAIPEYGAHSIILTKGLPEIRRAVLIDGFTQAGARRNTNPITSPDSNNAIYTVRLVAAVPIDRFFKLNPIASGTTIRGLAFSSATSSVRAIDLYETRNVSITGNYFHVLGADSPWGFSTVIEVRAGSHNTIGGSTQFPGLQNIFGRFDQGVSLSHQTHDNGIIGNIIGQANAVSPFSRGVEIAPNSYRNDVSLNYFFANTVAVRDFGRENVITNNTVSNG